MGQEPSSQIPDYLRFTPGRPLSRWYRVVAHILVYFYYSSLRFVTPTGHRCPPISGEMPTLLIASHRNGGADGWVFSQLLPRGQFLAAVQLLRSRLLRLMFSGIPVVRDRDRERYGFSRAQAGNPVLHTIAHIKAGGSVGIFPEGSSEWAASPQPYQAGMVKVVRRLMQEQIAFQVIAAGSFYQAPDRYGTSVELLVGEPLVLPEQGESSIAAWEQAIMCCLSQGLDEVSVNCADMQMLAWVEREALYRSAAGESYALAFKQAERRGVEQVLPAVATPACSLFDRLAVGLLILTLLPIWLCGWWTGRKADGRNNLAFLRLAGGFAMALFWLPCLGILAVCYPWLLLLYTGAAIGWWRRNRCMGVPR